MIDGGMRKSRRRDKAVVDEVPPLSFLTIICKANNSTNETTRTALRTSDVACHLDSVTPEYRNSRNSWPTCGETMYNSDGVGLAAPQVGPYYRIVVIDADP